MNNRVFEGLDKTTFKSMFWLVITFIKKQVALIVICALLFLTFVFIVIFIDPGNINLDIMRFFMIMLTPMMFSLISLPLIQGQISSSTLIKRIGSTRINENTFVLIIWSIFTLITLGIFWVLYFISMILFLIVGFPFNEVFDGIGKLFLLTPFYFSLFTSTGMLIGIIPLNQAFKSMISLLIFIMILFFSNVLLDTYQLGMVDKDNTLSNIFYGVCLSNPWTSSTYLIYSSLLGISDISAFQYFSVLFFTIGSSMLMLVVSFKVLSFNKIR